MTMPSERTRSVQWAADLLKRLINKKATPRVPQAVRDEARTILRHYPGEWDLTLAHNGNPATWGNPEPPEDHGFAAPTPLDGMWTLKLTDAQLGTVMTALEQYSRVGIGQLNVITDLARDGALPGEPATPENIEIAARHMEIVKDKLFGMAPNSSHSIVGAAVPLSFKRAWVLYSTLRHASSWRRAGYPAKRDLSAMMGVDFDEPWFDLGEPNALVEASNTEALASELPAGFSLSRPPASRWGSSASDSAWHVIDYRKADNTGNGAVWVGSAQSIPAAVRLARDAAGLVA